MLPEGAPERFSDRATLWNEVEAFEKRKDAQLAREVEFAIPREITRSLRATIGTAATIDQQNRNLWRAAGGGFAAGCLLMTALPGFAARIAPTGWHWPGRLATRVVREPTLWDAGTRLMRAGNPEGWQAIVDAADMRQANRDAIAACEQRAAKAKEPVRCTIRVRYRQP